MKSVVLRKWLCGVVVVLALAFITCQVSFAAEDLSAVAKTGEQGLASPDRGDAGIIRHRIPSKIRKGLRELDKVVNVSSPDGVQVFAAFVSDTASDVKVGDVKIVPVVGKDNVYLYIAFRVTSAMKVDVKWYLDDDSTPVHTEAGFEDPVTNGDLSGNYWYFAWYKASGIAANALHSVKVKVRESSSGEWSQDSCRFLVRG